MTKTQELQNLLYTLFQQYILNIDGKVMQEGQDLPEVYIPKSIVAENMIKLLNEFGEEVSKELIEGEDEINIK